MCNKWKNSTCLMTLGMTEGAYVKEARLSTHKRRELRTTPFDTETTFQTETKFLLPRLQSVKTLSERTSPQIPVGVSRHARLESCRDVWPKSFFPLGGVETTPWIERWGRFGTLVELHSLLRPLRANPNWQGDECMRNRFKKGWQNASWGRIGRTPCVKYQEWEFS